MIELPDFFQHQGFNSLREAMQADETKHLEDFYWDPVDIEDFSLGEVVLEGEDIQQLITDQKDGFFSHGDNKVLVYIRDQYLRYGQNVPLNYRFHVTDCSTLTQAIEANRNARFVLTTNLNGIFSVNLMDRKVGVIEYGKLLELKVCKNCLKKSNYKRYNTSEYLIKEDIHNNFVIHEFLGLPEPQRIRKDKFKESGVAKINEYPPNWKEISDDVKKHRNYICEECHINLEKKEHRKMLHTHHIDADKSNNRASNLKALCIHCHDNKPGHNLKSRREYRTLTKHKRAIGWKE